MAAERLIGSFQIYFFDLGSVTRFDILWGALGISLAVLWADFGPSLGHLGGLVGSMGFVLGSLLPSLACLRTLFGAIWATLGKPGPNPTSHKHPKVYFGATLQRFRRVYLPETKPHTFPKVDFGATLPRFRRLDPYLGEVDDPQVP